MKKPFCPFPNCEEECDPVTDPISGQPFGISGRGKVYFCPCHGHWDTKTPKSGRRFLEEQPAPKKH